MPPRHYRTGALQESQATDAVLSSLAASDTAGEVLQFNANDAGRIEVIMTTEQLAKPNSQRLSDLAKKRQREEKISFGESLSRVARERPELTLPDGMTAPRAAHHAGAGTFRFESSSEADTFRLESNSERLSDLAKERQREEKISVGEALTQVAAENPELTAPGTTIDFGERRPETNGEQLTRFAKERQRADKVSFGEALAEVARERPELTMPDAR
jgi:predicted transcriptional regulator